MKRKLYYILVLLLMMTQGAWGTIAVGGKLPGAFSVSATKKVWFSQGNLQHSGANTTGTWSFAANQYDRYGTNQTDDHRDLFGWGTKTTPNNTSTNDDEYTWADWGENKISNGGNLEGIWSTLTAAEWQYLFNRTNYRTMATVHSVPGLIMMPDGWTATTVNPTITVADYTTNVLTDDQWTILEGQGCVFLPTNGWRDDTDYYRTDEHAIYWTSTTETNTTARDAYIDGIGKHDIWTNESHLRHLGFCVRLVLQLWQGSGTAADPYLINNVYDWNKLSYLVNNGQSFTDTYFRLTADIDVSTMVGGNEGHEFSGTFDGDGHKLTVNISNTSTQFVAPFHRVSGGSIKNLYVDGTVSSNQYHMSGLIGRATGTVNISNCVVAVDIRMSSDYAGGFVGNVGSRQYGGESFVSLTDCLFMGTFTAVGGTRNKAAGFCGWGLSTPAFINCLENGTFNTSGDMQPYLYQGTDGYNPVSSSNSYYKHGTMTASWVANASGMSNVDLAMGLGSNWVIDAETNQPMPILFATIAATLIDGEGITALSTYGGLQCEVTYLRSFTEGKPSTVCLPFAYTKKVGDGSFYAFTGIEKEGGNYVATMTEPGTTTLTANTPYLYLPSETGDVDFSGTYTIPAELTAGSTTSGDWTFLGTYETVSWTEAPTGIYGFSAQNVSEQGISQGEFVKVGAYVRVKPMRCYLKYKNGDENFAGARSMNRAADNEKLPETISVRLIGANGEVTAIGTLHTKTGEVTLNGWYTLDGTHLSAQPTRKGIYVNNGKKYIIK